MCIINKYTSLCFPDFSARNEAITVLNTLCVPSLSNANIPVLWINPAHYINHNLGVLLPAVVTACSNFKYSSSQLFIF